MNRFTRILLLLIVLLTAERASAQYYTWGADPVGLKWRSVKSDDVRIIYPDTAESYAARTLFTVERIKPYISYGFRHDAMRIPFVMHPENFQSNGLVMWLPKRVEFLTSPAVESYSMPWYKQLSAHEYRHAVQYNNLNQGVIKVLSYLLGQQGSTVGLLFLPIWLLEGDAVLSETQMSSFGRGLQPAFTLEYRALGREVLRRKNSDKWFCGSFLDFTPDHYRLGYQIAAYSYNHYGENIWDKVAWYGVRNPYVLFTVSTALSKFYSTNVNKLFHATFEELNDYWDSLPEVTPTTTPIHELPGRNHTLYQWPVAKNDSTLIALKSALNRPSRLVEVDLKSGREKKMPYTGYLSSRPEISENGRLWWTEYRRSLFFEQRVNSRLCFLDADSRKPRTLKGVRNALYATPIPNGIAWVEYTPDGRYTLIKRIGSRDERLTVPHFKEVHGLAWDNLTEQFYLLITDDDGMWIATFTPEGEFTPLTRGDYVTLTNLKARDGVLYYGSIRSGRDEAHCYDLGRRKEYRLTESKYGAFAPTPIGDSTLVVSDYTRAGYRLAAQPLSTRFESPAGRLPVNLVNPPRKRWEVINLDTVRFTQNDSLQLASVHRSKRYRKGLNLFKVHSWMPLSMNPFDLIDEHNVAINWGATLLSQNLLSNTEAFFSWGYNTTEGSLFQLGLRYFGLGPTIEIAGSYGGTQSIYSLAQFNPITDKIESQAIPNLDRYYSLSAGILFPFYFDRGYHIRQLSFSAMWNYTNGLVAKLGEIRYNEVTGSISNIGHIGYSEGLHKLQFGIGYSNQVRTSTREFVPRWGYTLNVDYALNPSNGSFSDLISLFGRFYLPGITRPHSLMVALNYQTSIGGFHTPDGQAMLTYKSTRLLPHSYSSSSIRSDRYFAASINYQLPIWYPEGGITSVIYFKRIRLNVGFDYAHYRLGNDWMRLNAYGGDLLLDMNIFRQPDSATSTLKISVYKPRHGSVWVGAGIGLPF